jgi:PAS domain S-box-containing protein
VVSSCCITLGAVKYTMPRKILLVEDEALIAVSEAQILKKHGYEIVTVYNGKKAIETVDADHEISLILMDIDLGKGMDGTEAAKVILKDHDIPVVFLSSHTEPEVVEKTEKITSYGYVVKNSGETVLIASIKMAFRLHEAYRERLEKSSQLNTLLDNAEDLIGRLDRNKTHLYVNQALCEAMGISCEEYVGKRIEDLGGPPELTRKWNDAVDRVFENGEPVQIEFKMPGKESERVLDCKIVPEIVEDGKVKTVVAISRDITERKKAELLVSQSEQLFSKAFHSGPMLMAISTIENGTYLEVNNTFVQATGYSREETLGKKSVDLGLISPADRNQLKSLLDRDGRISGLRLSLRKKSGEPMKCLYFGEIIEVDGMRRLLSIAQDITESKRNEQKFRSLLQNTIDWVWQVDTEGRYTYIGSNIEQILGYKAEELIGHTPFDFMEEEERERVLSIFTGTLAKMDKIIGLEDTLIHKAGYPVIFETNATPLFTEKGDFEGYFGTCRDITERKKIEKELQNVINSISDGMAVIDRDFNILRTNTALLDDIGTEANSSLLGKKCYASFYGRDTFCEWCPAKEVFRTGREQSITVPFPAENPVRWFDLKASPVRNIRGEVVQVVEVARDLTDQKKIEETLTSSEKQKDVILNATAEMVAYYDTNLEIIWTNRTSAESVGESVEDLVGRHCYEVWQERNEPCEGCPVLRALETGKPQSAEHRTPDGRYWLIRGYPVFDKNGNVSNLVEFGQDITEQKRAEEERELYEERLAALLKLNEMDSVDQDELAEFALEKSVRLTRSEIGFINFLSKDEKDVTKAIYTRDTLKRCKLPENVSAFEISSCGLWSEAYRRRCPVIINDYKMPHPSKAGFAEGHPVIRRFISIPIFEGDRIAAVAALGNKESEYNDRDVKELRLFIEGFEQIIQRRKMEEQLRSSLAEKDYLMSELNHRVKNNLAIISSLIALKISALGNSVDLSDIKNQIDAVRIVHEKLYKSSDVTYIELRDYLRDLLTTVFSSFAAKAVKIDNCVENIRMPTKLAVPVGLITNEIATNAIKYGFTENEEALFTVDLSVDQEEGQYTLVLSNSGNPFPEDIDLDNPETLGLRLISALVDQLDGTIELKRKPSPRYTIRFPA